MSTQNVPPAARTAGDQIDAKPLTGNQKNLTTLVIVANTSESFDVFLIGLVVSLLTKPWNLTGWEAGIILACPRLGIVIGSIMWGALADRIGRCRCFFWCVLLFTVLTAITLLTPKRSWIMLAVLRVLVDMGVGGLSITSIPYVQEFVPAKRRGLLVGLASVFIPLGLPLGAQAQRWLADPIGWRGLIAPGALPVLLLIQLRQMPESPRFFQITGHDDEARSAYAWALQIPTGQVGALPRIEATSKSSFGVVFRKYPKQLAIITLGSFSFILGSFTIQSWRQTLLKDDFGFGMTMVGGLFIIISVADMLGHLGSAWLADRIGRRWVILSFGLLDAIGYVIAAFAQDPRLFFAGILVVMTFGDGTFGILNTFGAEQFSNGARSIGLGLGYGTGAMVKVVGPFLMGALIGGDAVKQNVTRDAVSPALYLFAALLVIGGVFYMFTKETRNVSLEKI